MLSQIKPSSCNVDSFVSKERSQKWQSLQVRNQAKMQKLHVYKPSITNLFNLILIKYRDLLALQISRNCLIAIDLHCVYIHKQRDYRMSVALSTEA